MHFGALRSGIRNWLRDYVRVQSAAVILIYIQIACALIGSLGALYTGVLFAHLGIALFALIYRLGPSYVDNSVPREADADLQNSFLSPVNPSITRHPFSSGDALGGSVYDPAYYSSLTGDGKDEEYLSGANQNHGMVVGSTASPERTTPVKPVINRSVQGKDIFGSKSASLKLEQRLSFLFRSISFLLVPRSVPRHLLQVPHAFPCSCSPDQAQYLPLANPPE
nr:uncharacterized protein LOC109160066 isoform X3 [Ipomoea batatas]